MKRFASETLVRGLVLLTVLLPTAEARAGKEILEVPLQLSPVELPIELSGAMDLRWSSEDSIVVGVRGQGLYAWKVGAKTALRIARSATPPYDYGRVAYSELGAVYSGALFGFSRLEAGRTMLEGGFVLVGDLDRSASTSLVVGLRGSASDETTNRYEGYIAWLVDDDEEPRGLIPTMDAGRGFDWCAGAQLPVGRFVRSDRVVVVPSAEAGAYVYDTSGKLVEALSVAALGVDEGCQIQREQMFALSNEEYATSWINQRTLVDEIVGDGVGAYWMFVRKVDQHRSKPVCWDLVKWELGETDYQEHTPCVVSSENLAARLRADLRGDRLFVLLSRGKAQAFLGTLRASSRQPMVHEPVDPETKN